ncbi:MAG TPA: copper resistance CopC family protein [Candidatus Binatia bacterium]|jgi:methionine-rich copper-binding protein CopC
MFSKFLIALSFIGLLPLDPTGHLAWAHAYPKVSSPENGAVVQEAPKEVRIQFTEGLELAFSRITVKGAAGEIVSQGKMRQPAQDTLSVDLKPLTAGNYVIEWQVLSVDTHITEGVLRFIVGAGK